MKTSTTIGMSQNRGSSSFIIHASWKKIANFSHWEFFAPTALVMWFFGGTPRLGWQASAINGSPPALPARGKWCIALLIEVCKRGVLMYVPSEEESTATVAIPFSSCIFMTIFTAQPCGPRWMDEVPGLTSRWLPKRVYISKTAQKETWAGNKRQVDDMQMDIFGRGKLNSGADPLQNGLRGHQQWWLVVTEKLIWWCII